MSQQEVGEPIVKVETVVTVLPDGRKVTKTIKRTTHQYQVQVPPGTPVPEGATLVSTVAADMPQPINGNTVTYQEFTSGEGLPPGFPTQTFQQTNNAQPTVVVESSVDENGRKVTKTITTTSSASAPIPGNLLQVQEDNLVNAQPNVVVQSTVDENGRKVTKTTTTSSSSSSHGPMSKLFKRFSKASKDPKPLPSIPVTQVTQVTQAVPQAVPQTSLNRAKTEPIPVAEFKKEYLRPTETIFAVDGSVFALSNCTGQKRAVLIGINYIGHKNQLHGCVNDTAVMKDFLLDVAKFPQENIRVLTDDQVGTAWMPTRENIINNLKWLIHDAKQNDSYFLHYSGHGGLVRDLDGDETDGKDDCIFPLDHVENGVIIDDELHELLVKHLPPGVRLTVVFDCCHSGSALDLPYMYTESGFVRGSCAYQSLGYDIVSKGFDPEVIKEIEIRYKKMKAEEDEFNRQVRLKAAKADVIMFSGCQDDQTSADVSIMRGTSKSSNGAMTHAFTSCIREHPDQSYVEMLAHLRQNMKGKYAQKPQLSSSRKVDPNELFHM
ncbi:Ca(2+)-dependent cysteine protease [Haplosporangium sp. Z 27]|nr:Ca(2+)-dependent cysteine protease [Haplosporangium sp. Z 27]